MCTHLPSPTLSPSPSAVSPRMSYSDNRLRSMRSAVNTFCLLLRASTQRSRYPSQYSRCPCPPYCRSTSGMASAASSSGGASAGMVSCQIMSSSRSAITLLLLGACTQYEITGLEDSGATRNGRAAEGRACHDYAWQIVCLYHLPHSTPKHTWDVCVTQSTHQTAVAYTSSPDSSLTSGRAVSLMASLRSSSNSLMLSARLLPRARTSNFENKRSSRLWANWWWATTETRWASVERQSGSAGF